MKLGGWQRLWILLSIVYLCVVVVGAFAFYPKDSSVSVWDVFQEMPPDTGEKLEDYYFKGFLKSKSDPPNITIRFEDSHHKLYFPESTTKEELEALSDAFHDAIPKAVKKKQRSFFLWTPLFWAIPCILLYVLGWSVGWVYRGFRRDK